ncbi:hypothetical protein PG989_012912 [Apiospora arundinis]
MSQASGSSVSLSKLPPEVWGSIASSFQLEPMDMGTYHPSRDFLANRANLRNLCLTNHTFAAAAQPFLYETIILYARPDDETKGPESLVQLLRTLVSNPVLQQYVRHLACALTLWPNKRDGIQSPFRSFRVWKGMRDGSQQSVSVLRAWQEMRDVCLAKLKPAERQLFVNATLLEPSDEAPAPQTWPYSRHVDAGVKDAIQLWNNDLQTSQKLLAILLCFTPRLQTLLLQGSAHQRSPIRPFSDLLEYFLCQQSGPQDPVLPLLSTIRLQPGPSALPSSWTGVQVCQNLLPHLPSLRQLDQWKSASYRDAQDLPDHTWANGLEEINVVLGTNAGTTAGFVNQAHSLRTLRLQCVPEHHGIHNWQPTPPQGDLNQAILHRAPTLARLTLTSMGDAFQWQHRRLSCLPQLPLVEELEIDHSLLVQFNSPGETQVPDLIPPNLRELKLIFHHGSDEHFEMFMLTFPLDLPLARSQGRLKELQKIHIEVFSVHDINNQKLKAKLDTRLALILETGCVCTYTLNRGQKPNIVI